ncbi:MAG: hemerythrin [Fibrobacteres bacterium]|nr:hemerythrin [Fibrobacterota bacterium]
MNVYEILQKDHETVKALFGKLEETTEDQVEERERLFQTLNQELTVHAAAEEKFFYPALKNVEESEDDTLEAIEEHKVVKKLLKELEANQKGTKEWAAKLKVLQENVEHHVEEEEGELFEKAEDILDEEEADSIGEEIEAYKAEHSEMEDAG